MSACGFAAEEVASSVSSGCSRLFFRKCPPNLRGRGGGECAAFREAGARSAKPGDVPAFAGESGQRADHLSGRNKVGDRRNRAIQAWDWRIAGRERCRSVALSCKGRI